MSQSTIIVVEIGLDKFELFCGSRAPAIAVGIELHETRQFADDEAATVLAYLPEAGAGRFVLFAAMRELAEFNRGLHAGESGWLKVTVSRYD